MASFNPYLAPAITPPPILSLDCSSPFDAFDDQIVQSSQHKRLTGDAALIAIQIDGGNVNTQRSVYDAIDTNDENNDCAHNFSHFAHTHLPTPSPRVSAVTVEKKCFRASRPQPLFIPKKICLSISLSGRMRKVIGNVKTVGGADEEAPAGTPFCYLFVRRCWHFWFFALLEVLGSLLLAFVLMIYGSNDRFLSPVFWFGVALLVFAAQFFVLSRHRCAYCPIHAVGDQYVKPIDALLGVPRGVTFNEAV